LIVAHAGRAPPAQPVQCFGPEPAAYTTSRLFGQVVQLEEELSTSADRDTAAKAVSYWKHDGSAFAGAKPVGARRVVASLHYRIERVLADGVLFPPRQMEHK
jgi:hypothetical protein